MTRRAFVRVLPSPLARASEADALRVRLVPHPFGGYVLNVSREAGPELQGMATASALRELSAVFASAAAELEAAAS